MRLTILQNDPMVPPGIIAPVAASEGIAMDVVRLDQGVPLPPVEKVTSLIALGGDMGAYETDRYPHLAGEKVLLAELVDRGVPVLGLCLGCQLLADALGGEAFLAERPEVAFEPMTWTADDPVVSPLGGSPTLVMHRDTWTLPPGARLIARSDGYNAAFRLGSALGVQPHPEVAEDDAIEWLSDPIGVAMMEAAGSHADDVLGALRREGAEARGAAEAFFREWFREAGLVRS